MLYATGLRLDELCHLRCYDIKSSSMKIYVQHSKNHCDPYIPMPQSIWQMILDYWYSFIKETFNGLGNTIEYLGKYTHKIAISNHRILSISETQVTFSARGIKSGDPRRTISISKTEFIRRYLMHVLPSGFQKIRYYGFLNNRSKSKNSKLIFKMQEYQIRYVNLTVAELFKAIWKIGIRICPVFGCNHMCSSGRTYGST